MLEKLALKVSVVMSVYNGEKHLAKAIASILNQTFSDFEFIIINDGSNDSSELIIRKFAIQDERIMVISRENHGLTRSLNEGIKLAKGEYVARMDADDIAFPKRLEKEVDYLDNHPEVGLVSCFARVINDCDQEIGEHRPPVVHNEIRKRSFFAGQLCHPAAVFRKTLWAELGGYDEKVLYAQDYELWFRLMAGYKVANIPEFLFYWRNSASGIGRTKEKEQRQFAQKARLAAIKNRLYPYYYLLFLPWPYVRTFIPATLRNKIKKLL